jgi:hypothetical protein
VEVKSYSGKQGVDSIALDAPQIIPAHPVLGLHMANHRLHSGSSFYLALDRGRGALHLTSAAIPNSELVLIVIVIPNKNQTGFGKQKVFFL